MAQAKAFTRTPPTVFLGKLLGLSALLFGLIMLMRKAAMIDTLMALMHDRPLLLIAAMATAVVGLAIVLSHNVWSGGALKIVVTLCGWLYLIKGIALLLLSPEQSMSLLARARYEDFFYLYAAVPLVLGVYLTWASFRNSSSR